MYFDTPFYDGARADEPNPTHQTLKDTSLSIDIIAERELADLDVCTRAQG